MPLPSGFPGYRQGVVADKRRGKGSERKGRYHRGLPGYHDPTAGIGGAAPATSALTLRLWLALFGLVTCTGFAIWLYLISVPLEESLAEASRGGTRLPFPSDYVRADRRWLASTNVPQGGA